MIESNISKVLATKKTLQKMESRIDKHIKDLDERVQVNTKTIEEIYDLVIATINKKKEDALYHMNDVREKENKISNEKKNKVSSHIQSIDQFLTLQEGIEQLSDLEILHASKKRDETLKQATKNAVDCSFTLSVLPELKKDVEINNFGKQLKNALRDYETANTVKSVKTKKSKKITRSNTAKQKESSNKNIEKDEINAEIPTNDVMNTSHDTELSTPVCISAKTMFEKQVPKPK